MKRALFAGIFASVCLMLGVNASAAEKRTCTKEQPCVLRIATVAPDNTPWAEQAHSLKRRVERESEGRINVRPRLGSTAGENSLARQCRDGSVEAIGVSTAAIATLVPALSVFEIPFLFDKPEDADRIIDRYLIPRVDKLLSKKGFQLYIFTENGFRNWATKGREIHEIKDFRGIQLRSQESWIHEAMYKALNANYTTIPVTEVQTALSTGRVQGFDNTPLFAMAAGWEKAIDTWMISDHIYQPAVVVYNKEWFDSLPDDLQEILLSNRKEESRSGRRLVRATNPLLIENLKANGIKVIKLTEKERAEMRKATMSIRDEFRKRVPSGAPLLDIIEKNL